MHGKVHRLDATAYYYTGRAGYKKPSGAKASEGMIVGVFL